jgi:hypothetical protein
MGAAPPVTTAPADKPLQQVVLQAMSYLHEHTVEGEGGVKVLRGWEALQVTFDNVRAAHARGHLTSFDQLGDLHVFRHLLTHAQQTQLDTWTRDLLASSEASSRAPPAGPQLRAGATGSQMKALRRTSTGLSTSAASWAEPLPSGAAAPGAAARPGPDLFD